MLAINFQGSSVLQFMPHSNTTLLGTKINTRAWGKYGANYTFTFNDENFVFVLVRSSKWLRNAKCLMHTKRCTSAVDSLNTSRFSMHWDKPQNQHQLPPAMDLPDNKSASNMILRIFYYASGFNPNVAADWFIFTVCNFVILCVYLSFLCKNFTAFLLNC